MNDCRARLPSANQRPWLPGLPVQVIAITILTGVYNRFSCQVPTKTLKTSAQNTFIYSIHVRDKVPDYTQYYIHSAQWYSLYLWISAPVISHHVSGYRCH